MDPDKISRTAKGLARNLVLMRRRRQRRNRRSRIHGPGRRALSITQRSLILNKTGKRCHICGGKIKGEWQADHVLAHSAGGQHADDNYLAAHVLCNHYRWSYLPEEFQQILKMGVWLRTQIELQTAIGRTAGTAFLAYEERRADRRRPARQQIGD